MTDLLWFIPKAKSADAATIRRAGLDRVFDADTQATSREVTAFEGIPGVVCAAHGPHAPRVGYWPEKQTWHNAGGQWVGYENDSPPKPEHLRRRAMEPGHLVRLADKTGPTPGGAAGGRSGSGSGGGSGGAEWLVPVIRLAAGGTGLPQTIYLDEAGELASETIARFAPLLEMADKAFASTIGPMFGREVDDADEMTIAEAFEFAVMVLQVNYRIDRAAASLLRLFDTASLRSVMQAAIDLPTIEAAWADMEAAKKKQAPEADAVPGEAGSDSTDAGSTTVNGSAGLPRQATDPAMPTSSGSADRSPD